MPGCCDAKNDSKTNNSTTVSTFNGTYHLCCDIFSCLEVCSGMLMEQLSPFQDISMELLSCPSKQQRHCRTASELLDDRSGR